MELMHIDIARLCVSGLNMRGNRKAPDLANILPSVRARGILVPLIVREKREGAAQGGEECPAYEIVAGKRRYHAALTLAQENEGIDPLPCAVMEAGDDAAALEASLIENIARLDPLGHVSEVSFDERSETLPCLFQAARSAYPKSWRRAAWNKHLRQSRGQIRRQHGCHAGAV
ncbi:putative plasmid stabilization protein [Sphingobium fuliginis]|uniref:Putative plasmid stabilization protein n=1 Tax=Sphingobium fuliginis (strain ATCC 27551) TaxID=336203 RepID=A0A292Z141_SPHSA|nr:putative plasmid stabilization protein [Sphingobium fuliginis]